VIGQLIVRKNVSGYRVRAHDGFLSLMHMTLAAEPHWSFEGIGEEFREVVISFVE
jgi:hypothetical protein